MSIQNYTSEIITAISGIALSVITWFTGRKSKEIEDKRSNADALQGIQNVYEKFIEQTDRKFEQMNKEMEELKEMLSKYINQCSKCSNNKIK